MDEISVLERRQCRLSDANMALHAAKQKGGSLTGKTLQQAAKDIATKAGKQSLVDSFGAWKQGSNLRNGDSQSFCILRADKRGNFQDAGRANQQPRIADQLFLLKNRREQLLLDIDDNQRTLLRFQRAAGDLGVIRNAGGNAWNDVRGSGHSRVLTGEDTSSGILPPSGGFVLSRSTLSLDRYSQRLGRVNRVGVARIIEGFCAATFPEMCFARLGAS